MFKKHAFEGRSVMQLPFEITQISDAKFVYDVFYKKTEMNNCVVGVISRFVTDSNYEHLRTKYVPDLRRITKKNVLLIVNPNGVRTPFPCYYWRSKEKKNVPYILISIHTEPFKEFIDVFSIVPLGIVHELLHELYDDCDIIWEKLSEFHKHFNEQIKKDEEEFLRA